METLRRALVILGLLVLGYGCGGGDGDSSVTLGKVSSEPEESAAGEALAEPVVVEVLDGRGVPRPGVAVQFAVTRGGGTVEPASTVTDGVGHASATWTLGIVPVQNELTVRVENETVEFETLAVLDTPYSAADFGDVNAFLTSEGIMGSTEDLAFDGEGRLLLGVPGALVSLATDGTGTLPPLTGEPLVAPLGVAVDHEGNVWVADSRAHALKIISREGAVRTVLTDDGARPLQAPNYVGVDASGLIYLSDPCLGTLLRYDPVADRVDAILDFDLPSEGGPNGFALNADGSRLYVATENTGLLCAHAFVGVTDEIAGLYAVDVSAVGFGERDTVLSRFALFGDGVAFDAEGNLYVIFDTQANFMLTESAVWVLPAGEQVPAKFVTASDRVLANLAFGTGDFGATTLYIARLAVPPFTAPETRGVERIETGIAGLPVPPPAS